MGSALRWLGRVLASVAFLSVATASADDLAIWSARQEAAGQVVVSVVGGADAVARAKEFSLAFSGQPSVQTASASPAKDPAVATVLLCVDSSGSVGAAAIAALRAELAQAFGATGSGDAPYRLAVISFGTRTVEKLAFTRDRHAIAKALRSLEADAGRDGKTRLYDTVAKGLNMLDAQRGAPRYLVVVSDGKDEGSTLTPEGLDAVAKSTGIPIQTVAWGHEANVSGASLSRLSKASGGDFYAAGGRPTLANALQHIAGKASPSAVYDLRFSYAPGGGAPDTTAALVRTSGDREAARWPLGIALARPAPTAAAPVAGPVAKTAAAAPSPWDLSAIVGEIRRAPLPFLIAAAAALLLVVVGIGVLRRREGPATGGPSIEPASVRGGTAMSTGRGGTIWSDASAQPVAAAPRQRRATQVGFAWNEPAAGRPTATLNAADGRTGSRHPIERRHTRVGASIDNDVVIGDDAYVSAHHAIFRFEAGSLYVEDLGSANGTFLNDESFKGAARVLSPGDRLRFGRTRFEVQAVAAELR